MHVDELGLPTVPEPKPEDPEDVSWALSTAEAMWARGDHQEGIKWVRRAAEAASEAEDDSRALELAKAAADLTGLIAKRGTSRASIDIEEVVPMSDPAPPPVPPKKPAATPASKPPTPRMQPTSVTKQVTTPSRPPAPLPSKTSQPPPAAGAATANRKPLGTNTKPPSMKPPAKKGRRSRENLDAEAKAAQAIIANAELPADTMETTAAIEVPFVKHWTGGGGGEREVGHNDPTFVGHVNDIQAKVERAESKSAAEWDADSTQNLTGDELPFPPQSADGDRKTAVVAVPHAAPPLPPPQPALGTPDFKSTVQSLPKPSGFAPKISNPPAASAPPPRKDPSGGPGTNPPATVVGSMQALVGGPSSFPNPPRAPHPIDDPQIVTSQAVRVVVWRDATGVHVAPAGTVVSAITVDAVLVALEPNADLTAWLTQKGR